MKYNLQTYLDYASEGSFLLKEIESEYEDILRSLIKCYQDRGIVYTIGCGGSSSTASHFTADLSKTVGGFKSICLSDNTPLVSAITNDLGWENVFEYQLKNWMTDKDVLVVFSVHGGSKDWSYNLLKAMKFAKKKGAKIIGFTGLNGTAIMKIADYWIAVPFPNKNYETPLVEGLHSVLTHGIIFELKERLK